MSHEIQFLLILLFVLAFGILLIYALMLQIRLWFYESIIKMVKDLIQSPCTPANESSSAGLGGCLIRLAIGFVLFVVFFSLLAA